jgi:hypothetical protein
MYTLGEDDLALEFVPALICFTITNLVDFNLANLKVTVAEMQASPLYFHRSVAEWHEFRGDNYEALYIIHTEKS